MARFLVVAVLALAALAVHAREAVPSAADPALEERVERLTRDLRCLVCQNQSIAESNAGLAIDLKKQVREMMAQGQTDQQIVSFMVQRYGDFVLFRPPVKTATWLLWFGPAALLLVGAAALLHRISAQRNSAPGAPLDEAAHRRAQALLESVQKEETV
jgi:cytochrome c-type biogenesis protein CcmH